MAMADVTIKVEIVRVWIRGTRAHIEYRIGDAEETEVATYDFEVEGADPRDCFGRRKGDRIVKGDEWWEVGRILGADGKEITDVDIYELNADTGEALLVVTNASGRVEVDGDRPKLRRVWYPAPLRVEPKGVE